MPLETYRDLKVWKKSVDLVEQVYLVSKLFPDDERFGLISQVRRAAVSIPANIAEGYGRKHRGDYLHHLSMARGSLMELETHLIIAVRLGFAQRERMDPVWQGSQEVGKMLNGLWESLQDSADSKSEP
jgi:four helix bundle protein